MGFFSRLFGVSAPKEGPAPRPFSLPAVPEDSAQTLGEQLEALKARLGAVSWERDVVGHNTGGRDVRLTMTFADGEKLCGLGATTRDAFVELRARIKKVHDV